MPAYATSRVFAPPPHGWFARVLCYDVRDVEVVERERPLPPDRRHPKPEGWFLRRPAANDQERRTPTYKHELPAVGTVQGCYTVIAHTPHFRGLKARCTCGHERTMQVSAWVRHRPTGCCRCRSGRRRAA